MNMDIAFRLLQENKVQNEGIYCTGFIPLTNINDVVRIVNITFSSEDSRNNIVFYDSNKAYVYGAPGIAGAFTSLMNVDAGVYSFTPSTWTNNEDVAFFRFSCGGISDQTIVTVNEEIVDETTSSYTNLADPTDQYWKEGYRISLSSGGTSECEGHISTNFIPAKAGDILRVKGIDILKNINSQDSKIAMYKTKDDESSTLGGAYGSIADNDDCYGDTVTTVDDISTITLLYTNLGTQVAKSSMNYIRIDGVLMDGYTSEDVIITINEEIV